MPFSRRFGNLRENRGQRTIYERLGSILLMMTQIRRNASETNHLRQQTDRAFLLRCWRENSDMGTRWHFLLEEVAPQRERQGFVALEDLVAFLRREFGDVWPEQVSVKKTEV